MCGGLYISLVGSGLTSFARARFINVMGTSFFFKKDSPEASFCMQREKERRREER